MTAPSSGQSLTGDPRPSVVEPMAPAVLEALRGSILKWEKIVDGTGRDEGIGNCPLCQMFVYDACRGCPVMTRTGRSGCHGTPYFDYFSHRPETAQAELDFLKSLLPDAKAISKTPDRSEPTRSQSAR